MKYAGGLTIAGTARLAFAALALTAVLPAQPGGLRLDSVSLYGSYYSTVPYASTLGHDYFAGASSTVAWSRTGPFSSVSMYYSASYNRDISHNLTNSLTHNFSFTGTRALSPRWSFSTGVSAQVMNTSEFVFLPTVLSQAAGLATSTDQLAGAVSGSSAAGNTQLTSLLNGAPLLESPARRLFYGDRILDASFDSSLTYAEARLSVAVGLIGTRVQALPYRQNPASSAYANLYAVPATTSGQPYIKVSYSLSPRTKVGISASTWRTISRFEDIYASSTQVSVERLMSERWFLEVHGGVGMITTLRSVTPLPAHPRPLGGIGVGFKDGYHSFLFSSQRIVDDAYGIGAGTTVDSGAVWTWARPGRSWTLSASARDEYISGTGLQRVNAAMMNAGITEQFSREMAVSLSYAYVRVLSGSSTALGDLPAHAVRLALLWTPSPARR